jgi:hypothetical protein
MYTANTNALFIPPDKYLIKCENTVLGMSAGITELYVLKVLFET